MNVILILIIIHCTISASVRHLDATHRSMLRAPAVASRDQAPDLCDDQSAGVELEY